MRLVEPRSARSRRRARPDRRLPLSATTGRSTRCASNHEDRSAGDHESGEEEDPGQEQGPRVLAFDPMGVPGIDATNPSIFSRLLDDFRSSIVDMYSFRSYTYVRKARGT